MRVGIGFDTHQFSFGRPLVLAGVHVPYSVGLQGHSDADVITHAVTDAMLGAACAGDLGEHFPDTDPQYKDAVSTDLLAKAREILAERGYRVVNVDAVVILQEPKIAPYRAEMRARLADVLGIPVESVSIKGKTTETLGFTGRGEGASAYAVVLLEELAGA